MDILSTYWPYAIAFVFFAWSIALVLKGTSDCASGMEYWVCRRKFYTTGPLCIVFVLIGWVI